MSSSYISAKERKVNEIVEKLFGTVSSDICEIVKADLMAKEDLMDEYPDLPKEEIEKMVDELLPKVHSNMIQEIKSDNKKYAMALGQLCMTYDENGNLHTITQLPSESEEKSSPK